MALGAHQILLNMIVRLFLVESVARGVDADLDAGLRLSARARPSRISARLRDLNGPRFRA
jgi:hypothetical protein